MVKAEFIAMRLAALADLDVAPVKLTRAANKDVLLIERFDRIPKAGDWIRKAMVSALTLLGLDETSLRERFQQLVAIARELLSDFRNSCGVTWTARHFWKTAAS